MIYIVQIWKVDEIFWVEYREMEMNGYDKAQKLEMNIAKDRT